MPLLAGVVSAALNITRLSASSERLVLHGVEATRYTQAIVRQVAAMERSARLFQLLGRTELLDVFHENRRRMDTVLAALERLPGDARRRGLIDELRRQTASIAAGLESTERADVAAALRAFGPLSQTGGQLSVLASRQIDRELIRLQDDTERARRRLLWQSAALVPISLGFAFVFTLLLGRPIRDIDEAIRKLGHGELAEPIKVKGTTDLEALGRQIEWLRQRLLEVSEERERFLRHMSHELKTPLANIREGTELLLDGSVGALSQGQREVTGILQREQPQPAATDREPAVLQRVAGAGARAVTGRRRSQARWRAPCWKTSTCPSRRSACSSISRSPRCRCGPIAPSCD